MAELTATVAHRDAAYHQLTAEVWWRRAQTTIARRGREDAESLARNAKELMDAARLAQVDLQTRLTSAEKRAAAAEAVAANHEEVLAAAKVAFNSQKKDMASQIFHLEEAHERQGLTLVQFPALPEPFLSLKPPNVSHKKCLRRAGKWTGVSP